MYDLNIGTIEDGYEDEIRIKLGVEAEELTNDMINSMTIIGAAELTLLDLVPLADSITDLRDTLSLNLAFINLAAYYAWPGLRLRLLQIESDNKSVAQRFAKALELDPNAFLQEGLKYIYKIATVGVVSSADIEYFEAVAPATDEITGNSN